MNTNAICPKCGKALPKDAPEGFCPACLAQAALASQPEPTATVAVEVPALPRRELPKAGEPFGGYRILRELGHGGMGAVYEAEHLESGRRVALKVLGHRLDSPEARARFLREGRLAASINHPNSVYVYGTEEIDGMPAIAMELIAGGTLQERVQRQGPLPVGEAVDAILQVIAGLEAAQAIGILHRDIKPANCFQDTDGTVKVGDFGLSISTTGRGDTNLTLQGTFLGTPAFCSPEQLRGEDLNVRSDMYSVGVTLFYVLTGRTPFEGKNMLQLLANALERPAPSPKKLRPELPQGLAGVVLRCLEKQAGERFKNYDELRQALAPFSSEAPVPAPLLLRFAAGLVDSCLLGVVGTTIGLATGLIGFNSFLAVASQMSPRFLQSIATAFFGMLAYYTVLEGRWGASVGKALCRLRVQGPHRNPPGWARAFGRAAIYLLLPPLPYWITFGFNPYHYMAQSSHFGAQAISLLYYVALALLFCTARRRNGLAAVHDLLTGTRVVRKSAFLARPVLQVADSVPPATEISRKIGPYHVIETLDATGGGEWLLGYDTRLLRKAWVKVVPPGTPQVPQPLRNLGRVGRLRWIAGRRSAEENWDAYEAPTGSPLLNLLGQRQPWSRVRYWLLDLATEISAAQKDQEATLPAALALDRIWITAEGRAKLLDFPAPGAPQPDSTTASPALPDTAAIQRFLRQVGVCALKGRGAGTTTNLCSDTPAPRDEREAEVKVPLPLHARKFLKQLAALPGIDAVVTALKPLLQQTAEVSWQRRAGLVLGCLAFPAVASLGFAVAARLLSQWQHAQPDLLEMAEVLNVRAGLRAPYPWLKDKPKPDDRAFAIYIASHYHHAITNAASWSSFVALAMIPPDNRRFAEQAVVDHPQPTPKELSQATAALQPYLPKVSPFGMLSRPWMLPLVAGLTLLIYVALPSLLCALLFRGGLVLRVFGLAIVRKDGLPASRLRVCWRSLVAWSPVLVAPVLLALLVPLFGLVLSETGRKSGPVHAAQGPSVGAVETAGPSITQATGIPPAQTNTSTATNAPATQPLAAPAPFEEPLPSSVIWSGLALALFLLGLAVLSIALPQRSVQDRLAGTCLVPR